MSIGDMIDGLLDLDPLQLKLITSLCEENKVLKKQVELLNLRNAKLQGMVEGLKESNSSKVDLKPIINETDEAFLVAGKCSECGAVVMIEHSDWEEVCGTQDMIYCPKCVKRQSISK